MRRVALRDGLELACEDCGEGPAVLFLHGWGTSRHVWEGQLADLAADFRIVTYDARGCGDSDRPVSGYTIAQSALDALAIADALGIERFSLVGSSLGGNAALEAAFLAPDRIDRLVTVDAPLHWFADGIDRKAVAAWLAQLRADRIGTIEAMVPGWFVPSTSSLMHAWTAAQLLRSAWTIDALIEDATAHDRRADMPRLRVPVHLFHGRQDGEVPLSVTEATAGLLPDASVQIIENCGHMPHLEQRLEFSMRLCEVLS